MNTSLATGLKWAAAGSGVAAPGLTFFMNYQPPLFPGVGIIVTALSGAILAIVSLSRNEANDSTSQSRKRAKFASICIAVAIISLITYVMLLDFTTVFAPRTEQRYQIGFGKWDRSLTGIGLDWKRSDPLKPVTEWMLGEAAFREGGAEIIWKPVSIYAAGGLLIATYMIAFILWTFGFALLVPQKASSNNIVQNK